MALTAAQRRTLNWAALAAARLGAGDAAAADLSAYLEHMPHAGDRSAIEERLRELGHGDRKRLH